MIYKSIYKGYVGSIGAALLFSSLSGDAITISLQRVNAGESFGNSWGNAGSINSSAIAGGGNLDSVVQAAAQYWENIILDTATVNFRYGWRSESNTVNLGTASRGNNNSATAYLRFNSNHERIWFADNSLINTLDPHSEYGGQLQQRFQNVNIIGGGTLNMEIGHRLRYNSSSDFIFNKSDLFSVVIHEMGHALGFSSGNSSYYNAIDPSNPADPDVGGYTIGPNYPGYDGANLRVIGGHLNRDVYNADKTYGQPLMSNSSFRRGQRTLASEIDILAVGAAGGYTDLNFGAATSPIPEPSSSLLLGSALTVGLLRRRR